MSRFGPMSLAELEDQLQGWPNEGAYWFGPKIRPLLPLLAESLRPGETIAVLSTGLNGQMFGLLALTDRRIVFAAKAVTSVVTDQMGVSFDYKDVTMFAANQVGALGNVTIGTSGGALKLTSVSAALIPHIREVMECGRAGEMSAEAADEFRQRERDLEAQIREKEARQREVEARAEAAKPMWEKKIKPEALMLGGVVLLAFLFLAGMAGSVMETWRNQPAVRAEAEAQEAPPAPPVIDLTVGAKPPVQPPATPPKPSPPAREVVSVSGIEDNTADHVPAGVRLVSYAIKVGGDRPVTGIVTEFRLDGRLLGTDEAAYGYSLAAGEATTATAGPFEVGRGDVARIRARVVSAEYAD
ncbi:MAG: hypothetical protein MH204_10225 [Fimbriimonadaceae bacterium]|nr:hypothetical protein [Fimbriimonadaceae bacterium]